PLAYLPFYIGASHQRGYPIYDFLDPDGSDFWLWAGALLAGYLLLGYLVWGIGRLRGAVGDPLKTSDDADRGAPDRGAPDRGAWPVSGPGPAGAPDGSAPPAPTRPAPSGRPPTP